MAALAGDATLHHEARRPGLALCAGAVKDGPLPTHYEPIESPVGNLLYPDKQQPDHPHVPPGRSIIWPHSPSAEFPVVACTFRLTEHYLSGPMSRFNSWLNELQPEMFVELSPELAEARGIDHGGWLTVRSARGSLDRPRHGHAPPAAAPPRWPDDPPGRLAFPLGLRGRKRRRQRQRPDRTLGRSQCQHARGQSFRVPGGSRPA